MELLWKSFFPKTSIYFFKVYYYYTGCPKKRKIPYNGLKIEIYEFNQFSCSPEKFFLYEVETFCQNTYIYIYTYIMCIFTAQGVLENRQCHDMGLKLKYMISIIIAAIPKICFLLWGGASCPNTYIPLFKVYFILWVCVYSIIDVYDLKQSNFLGHTLWWKFTLNEYIYVFGTKGHQKAQPHKPFFLGEQQ